MSYRRNKDIEVKTNASMVYLYDTRSKMCHVINDAGLQVWEYLQEPHTLSEIAEHILTEKSSPDALKEFSHFLSDLEVFSLVENV